MMRAARNDKVGKGFLFFGGVVLSENGGWRCREKMERPRHPCGVRADRDVWLMNGRGGRRLCRRSLSGTHPEEIRGEKAVVRSNVNHNPVKNGPGWEEKKGGVKFLDQGDVEGRRGNGQGEHEVRSCGVMGIGNCL